jgi:hypothetical protein
MIAPKAFMAFPLLAYSSYELRTFSSPFSKGGCHAGAETTPELSRREQDSL